MKVDLVWMIEFDRSGKQVLPVSLILILDSRDLE